MNLPRTETWKNMEDVDFPAHTREDRFQYKTDIHSNLASQTSLRTRNVTFVDNNI